MNLSSECNLLREGPRERFARARMHREKIRMDGYEIQDLKSEILGVAGTLRLVRIAGMEGGRDGYGSVVEKG